MKKNFYILKKKVMSKIKELKNTPSNTINLISVIEQLLVNKKTKYVEMFRKLINNKLSNGNTKKDLYFDLYERFPNMSFKDDMDVVELIFFSTLVNWIDRDNIKNFNQFVEYNERNLIDKNDLTTYKTFDEVLSEISKVDIKLISKEMEKQVVILYNDDEWLVIKPLTFESSKKYGSNTKWCTTSVNNPDYFFRYTKEGILIYCINKKTGYKIGVYKNLKERDVSFWNQQDERVDSFFTELSEQVITILRNEIKICKTPNGKLISSDERLMEMSKYLPNKESIAPMTAPDRNIRIENRFENDELGVDEESEDESEEESQDEAVNMFIRHGETPEPVIYNLSNLPNGIREEITEKVQAHFENAENNEDGMIEQMSRKLNTRTYHFGVGINLEENEDMGPQTA